MKVEIFNMCDFAQADSVGKLNILGIFSVIHAAQFPATHGLCALAIKLRFDKSEEGIKKFKISLIDSDGKSIMPPTEAQVHVRIPPNEPHANIQIVTLFPQLTFPHFGEYSVDLNIDGRQEASTPIFLKQAPTIPPHLQPPPKMA
jgi:hypothetical protein